MKSAVTTLVEFLFLFVLLLLLLFVVGWVGRTGPGIHGWSTTTGTTTRRYTDRNHRRHHSKFYPSAARHALVGRCSVVALANVQMTTTNNNNNHDAIIVTQPDSAFLSRHGVMDWPTWGCPVSKFPWSYSDTEVCYLTKGKVIVTPTNKNDTNGPPPAVAIAAGDYVTLPAGLSCTWDVIEAVEKHYMFI